MFFIPCLIIVCHIITSPESVLNFWSINGQHRNMIVPIISIQNTITSVALSMSIAFIITQSIVPTSTVVSLLHIKPRQLLLTSNTNTISVVVTLSESSVFRMNTVSNIYPINLPLLLSSLRIMILQNLVPLF